MALPPHADGVPHVHSGLPSPLTCVPPQRVHRPARDCMQQGEHAPESRRARRARAAVVDSR
jgi:hypothetical protein